MRLRFLIEESWKNAATGQRSSKSCASIPHASTIIKSNFGSKVMVEIRGLGEFSKIYDHQNISQ